MNYKLLFVIVAFWVQNCSAQTNLVDSVYHQLTWRTFKIHLPPSYSSSNPLPLVVALHGGGHNADTMEYISNLSLKADLENFIVVYPNGRKFITTNWNAGNCCGASANLNVDDVGFISKMMDSLQSNYAIDADRVYLTGASNGGMLAYRIACELSELFAAVAPVAATMLTTNPCVPSQDVPILHIHSSPDTQVPLIGGIGTGPSGAYMPPNDSIMNVWRQNNSCTGTLDTIYNQAGTIGLEWTDCVNCSELFIYTTSDGGHSWPGGNQTVNGDVPSLQLNATDLIWSFFQNHALNCNPLSIKKIESEENFTLFPNPTNNWITIRVKEANSFHKKTMIFSVAGELLTESTSDTIDLSQFENGVYLVVVHFDDSKTVKKIVKY